MNLTNTGKDSMKFNISFVQIRMLLDGGFEQIMEPDSGQFFANPFLRYYPRTVTLAPGESQVVKVQLVKTKTLSSGEYRSHLYFRPDLHGMPLNQNEEKSDTSGIAIKLKPSIGLTIPVIIEIGETVAKVTISNLSLGWSKDSIPELSLDLNRVGNNSVYGALKVNYISPGGKSTLVAEVKGVAIYAPGKLRKSTILLKKSRDINYREGKITIAYTSLPVHTGIKLSEAELQLL